MEKNTSGQQIAGAIIIAGVIIAGAILLKGNTAPTTTEKPISKIIGLNTRTFDACILKGKFKAKVQADIDDGVKAGVNGTPTSFILKNGIVVDRIGGALPFESVTLQIKSAMETEKKPLGVEIRPVTSGDHILGNLNAKIIIVEYSDLDCPFCKTFHNTMYQVIKSNSDVAWVYRHYPITGLHPNAFKKAEETECASDQKGNDGFWKYTDTIFGITQSK